MKIAMIASEANPLYHSGGLAEVTYSLSKSLNKNGHETIIILPYYKKIKEYGLDLSTEFVSSFNIFMSWRNQYAGIFKCSYDNITFYLIDNEQYFMRDELYGYSDDSERFAFFSLASLEALKRIDFRPDIIHVHDWQTAIIPCLIKEKHAKDPFFSLIKTVLTIHNPAFKGFMDKYYLNNYFGLSDSLYDLGKVRFDGLVSTLKAGIVYADKISTVSPSHRDELLDPISTFKFNYVLELRKDDFVGIINGIDYDEFNPETDENIAKNYSKNAFIKGKEICKNDLLKSVSIPQTKGPVYGLVTRLSEQKGIDLILANIDSIVSNGGSVVVLGSGEKELEDKIQKIRDKYPNNVGIYIGYNSLLSHKVFAGSDFFIMPSLYEPCGIGQLIAKRYGTLPIVRLTGGLKDTVVGYKNDNIYTANGFTFSYYTVEELNNVLLKSSEVYAKKDVMNKLIKNALNDDSSWESSSKKYIELYEKALLK